MKAKRRLKNFDFSGGNAAVSLVHKEQGGAANSYTTLVMKSTDVVVELSMAEFLARFFSVWDGDAKFIADMLGYSSEITYDLDELKEKVTLLESLKPEMDESEEKEEGYDEQGDEPYRFPLDMGDLSDRTQNELRELTKALADSSNIKITDFDVVFKNAGGVSPVSETLETPDEVLNDMSTEMIEKSVVEEMLKEEIEKAVATAKEEKAGEYEDIVKSLKEQIDAFQAEKMEVKKAQFVEKAKEFEALGVEDFDQFGVALMKMAESEELSVVSEVLAKALNIAKNASVFEENGHDIDASESQISGVQKALDARKKSK